MSYSCAICGKTYKTINERAACESACVERVQKEEAEKKRAAAEKNKNEMLTKIKDSIKDTDALIKSYRDTFNEEPPVAYYYQTSISVPRTFSWPSILDLLI